VSTKIHATVDALGNPLGFHLTAGQACDLAGADVLLPEIAADTVLADKGYDADARVIDPLQAQGKTAVIPPKRNRTTLRTYDQYLYKVRHLIENFFAKLKQYRAIATREGIFDEKRRPTIFFFCQIILDVFTLYQILILKKE
jgi:transposase